MDLFDILSMDQRVIVFSSLEDRTLITWNHEDTLQWWRPIVRQAMIESQDEYEKFNPNDFEEVSILTQSGNGPKTFDQARKVAIDWYNGVIDGKDRK